GDVNGRPAPWSNDVCKNDHNKKQVIKQIYKVVVGCQLAYSCFLTGNPNWHLILTMYSSPNYLITLTMSNMKLLVILCFLLSGCTAHSINNNVNVSICVKAL
ncbi:hypothetical protein ABFP05_10770, partial [Acinetobacter baumannii]